MGMEDAGAHTKLGDTVAGLELVHAGTQERSIKVGLRLKKVLVPCDHDETGKGFDRYQKILAIWFSHKNRGRGDPAKMVAGTNVAGFYVEPVAMRVHRCCKVRLVTADARRESRREPREETPPQPLD